MGRGGAGIDACRGVDIRLQRYGNARVGVVSLKKRLMVLFSLSYNQTKTYIIVETYRRECFS